MVSSGSTKYRNLFLITVTGNQGIKLFSGDLVAAGAGVVYVMHQRVSGTKVPIEKVQGSHQKCKLGAT